MKTFKIALPLIVAAGLAHADPVTIASCGASFTYEAAPTRAITLNQQATEVMLALGLEAAMVGTAYIDDAIPAQWLDAYNAVPVLAERYPAREIVVAAEPDFLFAGFASAFNEDNLGAQDEWNARAVGTYLVDASCRETHPKDRPFTIDPILTDIETIGRIFRVEDRATALAADMRARLEAVQADPAGDNQSVFIFDSGDATPYSVGCCGTPTLLTELVGLSNIANDVAGTWVDLAWERVVAADPDVIVLIEADWSTAADKRAYMEADPVLSELRAVQEGRFVTVPFSETLLGMRFADGVERLNAQLAALN
ncbi:ABC transporter substrate-binding protein [Yoonia sp.]|uniref:ABC transporter substrate-binding protein n=1 Tax=Yoonia sp. TaxID=2212373 RepID=UPI002FD93349